jgi:nucleotide-binding universal stress UspA family protein
VRAGFDYPGRNRYPIRPLSRHRSARPSKKPVLLRPGTLRSKELRIDELLTRTFELLTFQRIRAERRFGVKAKVDMKAKRILVPIDLERCPLEVFSRVNAYVESSEVSVILLSVINLNIASPENRVYEELSQEVHWYLERLARERIHPDASVLIRVRFGKPAREIRAEAKAQRADLVILPVFEDSLQDRRLSLWNRLSALLFPDLAHQLVRALPCALLIIHAHASFNCQQAWGCAASANTATQHSFAGVGATKPQGASSGHPQAEANWHRRFAA